MVTAVFAENWKLIFFFPAFFFILNLAKPRRPRQREQAIERECQAKAKRRQYARPQNEADGLEVERATILSTSFTIDNWTPNLAIDKRSREKSAARRASRECYTGRARIPEHRRMSAGMLIEAHIHSLVDKNDEIRIRPQLLCR